MRLTSLTVWSALAILATTTACQKASPTRPTDVGAASAEVESVTDARTGATIIAGRPLSPANQAEIAWPSQPITLSISNGLTTGSSPITYTFQVAGDPAFANIIFQRENVAPGTGNTATPIEPRLAGARTYFWRVQANLGSGAGPYSQARQFAVGPEVVLGAPALASPINGAAGFSPLALTITNITRSGPVGPIAYEVQVAADAGFGNVLFTGTGAEAPGGAGAQTTVTAAVSGLVNGTNYYWRARATDTTNRITTPYSPVGSFVVQSFSFASAKVWDNPPDLGSWPQGARITYIEFTGFSMRVDFDRRDGPGRWPDAIPPGFAGPLQYTLGMCRNLGGEWHCSAVVQFWYGRSLDDTAPANRFWREWWYDGARWGPLADAVGPAEGEIVGIFVGAGDLRGRFHTRATCPRVCEVSNVAMVPFTNGSARYIF